MYVYRWMLFSRFLTYIYLCMLSSVEIIFCLIVISTKLLEFRPCSVNMIHISKWKIFVLFHIMNVYFSWNIWFLLLLWFICFRKHYWGMPIASLDVSTICALSNSIRAKIYFDNRKNLICHKIDTKFWCFIQ